MVTPNRSWTVNRPGALTQRAPDLWTVDDAVPGLPRAGRRMAIVRRPGGKLVFFNAVPVPDSTLAQIKALGAPSALVVPNHLHAIDAGAFAERLQVQEYAPAPGVPMLAERVPCKPIAELSIGDDLRVFTNQGFKTHEISLLAGGSLLVADLVTNVPHGGGFIGLAMRLVGFTGPEPRLPRPVRKRVEVDAAAVRALLTTLSQQPGLQRIIPTHGAIVEGGAAEALRRIAGTV